MRRTICLVLAAVLCAAVLAGCVRRRPDLPAEPVIFTWTEAESPRGAEDGESRAVLEGGGKGYVPYGLLRAKGPLGDLSYAYGDCLGYVAGDENDRLYALQGDDAGNWLISYYVNGMMEVPMVLRELNDRGDVPESVEPFEDEGT